jgi:hypothetical protein
VSASVQGPEPARVGLSASQRRFIRVLAFAAMLLVAAFAATAARAQDAVEVPAPVAAPPDPVVTDPAPPPTVPDLGPSEAPAQDPPADDPPDPVVTDPGTGDTLAETPASTPDPDRTTTRQPSHATDGGGGGQSGSAAPTVPTAGEDTTVDTVAPSSDGYPGSWNGQDTFVVDRAKDRETGAAGATSGPRGPFSGLLVLHASSRASSLVAKARRSHSVAQVSPLGVPPGSGNLPGHNPFFDLMSGPGGSAAGLALASILAILGVAFVLPRDRLRTFRMPAVSWRPLAYVPPIELPG